MADAAIEKLGTAGRVTPANCAYIPAHVNAPGGPICPSVNRPPNRRDTQTDRQTDGRTDIVMQTDGTVT